MEIIAAIVTIVSGYFGAGVLGLTLNWPDAGAVVAIAVMGVFILIKIDGVCAVNKCIQIGKCRFSSTVFVRRSRDLNV